ncbi:MAG: hypothetical protein ACI4EU_08150 [Butyrivibrio sp.]
MRYCGYCGSQMGEAMKFCPNCGKSIQQMQQSEFDMEIHHNSRASAVRAANVCEIIEKIKSFMKWVALLVVILQTIALCTKMPDSENNYFFVYGSNGEAINAAAPFVIIFSVAAVLFMNLKKDYGVVSLICSIVSCILVSYIINAVFLFSTDEYYGFYSMKMFKAELRVEGGAFGFNTLSVTKVLLIIISAVNCIATAVLSVLEKKVEVYGVENDSWVCPACGNVNPGIVKMCECGCICDFLTKRK